MTRRATRAVIAALLTVPACAVLVTGAAPAQAATTTESSATVSPSEQLPAASDVIVKGRITYKRTSFTESRTGGGGDFFVYGPDGYSINQPIPSCTISSSTGTSCFAEVTLTVPAAAIEGRSNGAWPVKIKGSTVKTFYSNLPPATPSGLTAKGTGASRVDLTWSYGGDEADLTGFVISDDKGNSFPVTDASARSFTAYYDNPTPGTYGYSYTVKAHRKSGTGDGTVSGGASNTASAELVTPQPPPPPPSPTAEPTTDPGSGGTPAPGTTPAPGSGGTATPGSGGTSSPGSGATSGTGTKTGGTKAGTPTLVLPSLSPVVATRRNYALSFNKFSPSLGIPKLPPLPATTFSTTAAGAGGYQPTLPYDAQDQESEPDTVLTAPLSAVTSLDSAQLAKSLAFALILIAAAAHMRLFLSSHRGD